MSASRSGVGGCGLVILVVSCLLVTVGAATIWFVPGAVAQEIGPPSPGLGSIQRIVVTWQLFVWRDEVKRPMGISGQSQQFTVRMGETANSVAARLEENGLVANDEVFRLYLIYKGFDRTLQAGDYELDGGKSIIEIAADMQDATPTEVVFNILAGWRLEEIAAALPTSGLQVNPQEFIRTVRQPRQGLAPDGLGIDGSLEGFLLPGSYKVLRQSLADEMVLLFINGFDQAVDDDLRRRYEQNGLTFGEAVVLASIIQREAIVEEEQPMIASVFYNRLAVGMALESDPTVQYALGYNEKDQTWWTNPLSAADLGVNSPYNTYINIGIPPGPICNPSLSALRSVAYPAETPYFFFRAACDGSGRHSFAVNFDEHLQNACP